MHLILEAYTPTKGPEIPIQAGDQAHINMLCNGYSENQHFSPQIETSRTKPGSTVSKDNEGLTNIHDTVDAAQPLLVNDSEKSTVYHSISNMLPMSRKVFVLSAKSEESCKKQVASLLSYMIASQKNSPHTPMDDLAFTLAQRWTLFEWRLATSATSRQELIDSLQDPNSHVVLAKKSANVGMIFTGQGSQWHAMGQELMQYPVFAATMRDSDMCIRALGAQWSLLGEMM